MKKQLVQTLGVCMTLGAGGAQALDGITLNGFLTAGGTYGDPGITTTGVISQDGNIREEVDFVQDSRIGIQLSAKVNPRVSVTGQLLARAREENYNMKADWAFVTYQASQPLAIRGGKLKLSTFLVSDYIEVGYAYPWVRPPQEIYTANPISTINGVDMLLRFDLGPMNFLFQPFFGTSRGEQALVPQEVLPMMVPAIPTGTVAYMDFTADRMAGVNMSLGSDEFTLRAGYLEASVTAADFPGVVDNKAKFASVGATMDWHNVVLYSEYFEREVEGFANLGFPNQKGYYGTLGYRMGKWLPHVTYAELDDNEDPESPGMGTPLLQTSTAVGLRYELGSGAALKLEAKEVEPEQGNRGLLIAVPPEDKVNIYSVAVDVVF